MRLLRPAGGARRVGAQDLDVAPRVTSCSALGIVDGERALELRPIDDHVGVGELAQLEQLGVGERGLRRAAASDHDDLATPGCRASTSSAWSAVSVGASSAGASTSMRATSSATLPLPITTARSADSEVDLEVGVVGMAVVPADELGRRVRAGQLFAGDPERPVDGRAGRVDDRVVVLEQLLAGDVLAEGDVAEVAEARVRGGLLVDACHRLDLRVVGRDARAHQPPRRGQPLDHVDLDRRAARRP